MKIVAMFRDDSGDFDAEEFVSEILGIICDGENYYRLKTVRDREVVQPAVLRMLGWDLVHIWTLDWMLHSEVILKRLQERLERISRK